MIEKENRIVVCAKCGCLYDLHYIDNVEFKGKNPRKFECKNCGMVDVVHKNLEHFMPEKKDKAT